MELRQQRLSESQTVEEWWKIERQMIQKTNFNEEVKEMYQQSLSFDKFRDEFCSFGKLTMITWWGINKMSEDFEVSKELIKQLVDVDDR